jgi:hypothetical protein
MNYPVSYENIESEDKGAKGPIFAVINKYSGINITVEVLEKQRTTKSIVEIMNNYGATLKVFNLEYDVKILSQNYSLIGDNEAGRVEATISKDSSISKVITVLIPLKNVEITIIFNGTEKAIKNNTNQINKIIDSIKIK